MKSNFLHSWVGQCMLVPSTGSEVWYHHSISKLVTARPHTEIVARLPPSLFMYQFLKLLWFANKISAACFKREIFNTLTLVRVRCAYVSVYISRHWIICQFTSSWFVLWFSISYAFFFGVNNICIVAWAFCSFLSSELNMAPNLFLLFSSLFPQESYLNIVANVCNISYFMM